MEEKSELQEPSKGETSSAFRNALNNVKSKFLLLAIVIVGLLGGIVFSFTFVNNPSPEKTTVPYRTMPNPAPPRSFLSDTQTLIWLDSTASGGAKGQFTSDNVSVVVGELKCGVKTLFKDTSPGGGDYCLVALTLYAKNEKGAIVNATTQSIYGMPVRAGGADGFFGTFFAEKESQTKSPILKITPATPTQTILVFDVPKGFKGTSLLFQG